jgi:hypothetical protein
MAIPFGAAGRRSCNPLDSRNNRGRAAASVDAAGSAIGSVGLFAFALSAWQLAPKHGGWDGSHGRYDSVACDFRVALATSKAGVRCRILICFVAEQQVFSKLRKCVFRDDSLFHNVVSLRVRSIQDDAIREHTPDAVHGHQLFLRRGIQPMVAASRIIISGAITLI